MKLQIFRSLWGSSVSEWPELFKELKLNGFAGVEASLADIGFPDNTNLFFKLLLDNDLKWICGLYTGWFDYQSNAWSLESVQFHVVNFAHQLKSILDLPIKPIHINSHTGSDHFNEQESIECFDQILKIQETSVINVSHETHRGRILYSPWAAIRLCSKFPQLKLTLDISHWNVVSERFLDIEILDPILRKVNHIHARVGNHEMPQVGNPREEYSKDFTRYHHEIWQRVWDHQRQSNIECSTLTPEYGPAADFYMPTALKIVGDKCTRIPETDLNSLIFNEAKELRSDFLKHK